MVLVQIAPTQPRDPHFDDHLSGARLRAIEIPDLHLAVAEVDNAPHTLISQELNSPV